MEKNFRSECDNFFLRSIDQEMFLHKIRKSLLSIYDDKRCYLNEIESEPWNSHNLITSHSRVQNRINYKYSVKQF